MNWNRIGLKDIVLWGWAPSANGCNPWGALSTLCFGNISLTRDAESKSENRWQYLELLKSKVWEKPTGGLAISSQKLWGFSNFSKVFKNPSRGCTNWASRLAQVISCKMNHFLSKRKQRLCAATIKQQPQFGLGCPSEQCPRAFHWQLVMTQSLQSLWRWHKNWLRLVLMDQVTKAGGNPDLKRSNWASSEWLHKASWGWLPDWPWEPHH